jgi:hypothetical protein
MLRNPEAKKGKIFKKRKNKKEKKVVQKLKQA